MARDQVGHWDILCLCYNIFDPTWLEGLENVVLSINGNLEIPYAEEYMSHPLGSLVQENVLRHPILQMRHDNVFNKEWPKMEASITFLLRWRGIMEEDER